MGCCGSSASKSKQTFIDTALENDAAFRKLLATCGADRKDVVKMFDAFAKIDKQGNGTVDKAEFFEFYGKGAGPTISSEMYDGLFLVLDDDKTQTGGLLAFREFFIGCYNLCTCKDDALVALCFNYFDTSDDELLGIKEIQKMLRMIYGERYATKAEAEKTYRSMNKDDEKGVSLKEFKQGEYKNPNLTKPMKVMQAHLRKVLIGEAYWAKQTATRQQAMALSEDLIVVYKRLRSEVADDKRLGREIAAQSGTGKVAAAS